MNIKSVIIGVAFCMLGLWFIYRAIAGWQASLKRKYALFEVQHEQVFPVVKYVAWGVFSIAIGLVAMFLGYICWWGVY